jgi:hypothetical protein
VNVTGIVNSCTSIPPKKKHEFHQLMELWLATENGRAMIVQDPREALDRLSLYFCLKQFHLAGHR